MSFTSYENGGIGLEDAHESSSSSKKNGRQLLEAKLKTPFLRCERSRTSKEIKSLDIFRTSKVEVPSLLRVVTLGAEADHRPLVMAPVCLPRKPTCVLLVATDSTS